MTTVPQGWHDDGKYLTAPNGVQVVLGFRSHVLASNWDANNWPLGPQYYTPRLEDSNPELGDGDQIVFRKSMLGYPHNPQGKAASMKDTVIEEYIGTELLTQRANVVKYYTALKAAQAQIQQLQSGQPDPQVAQLQAQVADLQQQLDAEKAREQSAKSAVEAALAGL